MYSFSDTSLWYKDKQYFFNINKKILIIKNSYKHSINTDTAAENGIGSRVYWRLFLFANYWRAA